MNNQQEPMSNLVAALTAKNVIEFFEARGLNAEQRIIELLVAYCERKRAQEWERERYEKSCADAEKRAEAFRARGLEGAAAVGETVFLPSPSGLEIQTNTTQDFIEDNFTR